MLPPDIRANLRVPFPSLVTGSGPVTISKSNGIWTVSLAFQNLAVQTPPSTAFPHDYVIVWDSIQNTYFRMPLNNLLSSAQTARLPTANASVPIATTDVEVGIDSSVATSCQLPDVAAWVAGSFPGLELCIFDYTGHGATNNVTIVPNGTDVFVQGIAPSVRTNYGSVMLRPIIDAIGGNKWFVRHMQ